MAAPAHDCPKPLLLNLESNDDLLVLGFSDGAWSQWSSWSACSKTCSGGIQIRKRTCSNPIPQFGGRRCLGDSKEEQRCNTTPCPIGKALCIVELCQCHRYTVCLALLKENPSRIAILRVIYCHSFYCKSLSFMCLPEMIGW